MKISLLITVLFGSVVLVAAVGGGIWYTTSVSPTICWGKDADFDSPDADQIKLGITHLHIAAAINACESAARLITHGADVNARSKSSGTPLHFAASTNSVETAKLLIVHGTDVNVKDKNSWTPLHHAARGNAIEVAELLIANGADVNAGYGTISTPLRGAIFEAERVEEMAEQVKYPSKKEERKHEKLKNEHEKMVQLLRAHGGVCEFGC